MDHTAPTIQIKCSYCPKTFRSSGYMNAHRLRAHGKLRKEATPISLRHPNVQQIAKYIISYKEETDRAVAERRHTDASFILGMILKYIDSNYPN